MDGRRIDGRQVSGGRFLFDVPPRPREIAIASRAAEQDELGRARDPRRLGVGVARVLLWPGNAPIVLEAAELGGQPGFRAREAAAGYTWTDGRGLVPPHAVAHRRWGGKLFATVAHTAHCADAVGHRAAA